MNSIKYGYSLATANQGDIRKRDLKILRSAQHDINEVLRHLSTQLSMTIPQEGFKHAKPYPP